MKPVLLALAMTVAAIGLGDRPAQAQYYTYSSGYTYPGSSNYYTPNYSYAPNVSTYQPYSVRTPSAYWNAYTNYRVSPTYGTSYFPKPIGYAGYYPGYPTFSTSPLSRFGYPVGFQPVVMTNYGYGW